MIVSVWTFKVSHLDLAGEYMYVSCTLCIKFLVLCLFLHYGTQLLINCSTQNELWSKEKQLSQVTSISIYLVFTQVFYLFRLKRISISIKKEVAKHALRANSVTSLRRENSSTMDGFNCLPSYEGFHFFHIWLEEGILWRNPSFQVCLNDGFYPMKKGCKRVFWVENVTPKGRGNS